MGTIVTNTGIETANRKTVKEILGSKFILTRALCEPEANSRFKGYPTVNDPKNPWGEISVKTRGEILAELACQAFDLN